MSDDGRHLGHGAYGLALPDVPGAAHLLVRAPVDWPDWRIRHRPLPGTAGADEEHDFVSPDEARLRLSGGGHLLADRCASSSTLVLPERPADTEVVHPFLALTAAVAARWRGWQCFHAGGILVDGGVWGVLGDKGTGKSSTLAWLARHGAEVLCDDVLVVDDDGEAVVGPRCIDLRGDAAAWLGEGEALGLVGARERWRMQLGPTVLSAPLRGWVALAWDHDTGVEPVPPLERLPLLARNMSLRLLPPNGTGLMDLTGLPVWRLRRPRRLDAMGESAERLIEALRA